MSTTKSTHKCVFAVSESGDHAMIVSSEPTLEQIFDGLFLADNADNIDDVPRTSGLYSCVIECIYESHYDHYSGGTEYELTATVGEIKQLYYTK